MTHRHFSVLLILLGSLLFSVVVITAAGPMVDAIQEHRAKRATASHIDQVVADLEMQLREISRFARSFPAEGVDQKSIGAVAAKFIEAPDVHGVEFATKVTPTQRPLVAASLKEFVGHEVEFASSRNGRTVESPADETLDAPVAIWPLNRATRSRLGGQRSSWIAARLARKHQGRAFLEKKRNWYSGTQAHYAAFVTTGRPNDESSGLLLITLNKLASSEARENRSTRVSISDVTPNRYRPFQPENASHRKLRALDGGRLKQVARKQIGGRLYRFEGTLVSELAFRPTWILWTLFFLSNLVAGLIAMKVFQRESDQLRKLNRKLQKEIGRRAVLQRHLQMALDSLDDERERVADEIHESLIQDVVGAQMMAESARPASNSDLRVRLQSVATILSQTVDVARRTMDRLRPSVFSEVGLVGALETLAEEARTEHNFSVTIINKNFPRLPISAERMMYRMIEEAVDNARKHSGARNVLVHLEAQPDAIHVEISDSGQGFDPAALRDQCVGLSSLRQRAGALGGEAVIQTCEFGTQIKIVLPRTVVLEPTPILFLEQTDQSQLADSVRSAG